MKFNKENHKGISFKILCSFLIIISIIIFLIWLLEILLFAPIYKSIQTKQVTKINDEIIENYQNYTKDDYVKMSIKDNCNIIIFKIVADKLAVEINTSRDTSYFELEFIVNEFIYNLNSEDSVEYVAKNQGNETINVGKIQNFNGEDVYFYTSSVLTPLNGVVSVTTIVLLIISIVSLIITILVSIVLSKKISKPIQNISNQARQLSSGNLNIEFNEKGYKEVELLSNTLNYSISEIKKSDKIQKEIVQNVSHELKTPLTLIESYAELINDYSGDDPKKRKKHIQIILEETSKLNDLINDMLDLSKMQANTIVYNKETYNLCDSIEKFETFYINKHKDFLFEFHYPKECFINADKKRMEQVITNLINNAINYSQKENKHIIVTLKRDSNNRYKFSVQDFGIGISEEDKKLIFNRHFRSTSVKRAVVGSGIGLTIVKEILTYHNFEYGVESELNNGSTFYFYFDEKENLEKN